MSLTGANETVIFSSPNFIESIGWSPDASKIAFVHGTYMRTNEMHVINSNGGTVKILPLSEGASESDHVNWTADGWILISQWNVAAQELTLRRWNPDTDEIENIINWQQWGAANGYSENFSAGTIIDVNRDNIAVFDVDDTYSEEIGDGETPVIGFMECVPGAEPTLINARDMPDWGWEIYQPGSAHQPYYAYPYQIWWSPDSTQVMWHNEVPTPEYDPDEDFTMWFREWQALAMKPDTSGFWTHQFAPDGITGTNAAFTDYEIWETDPPNAYDSYVPTWASDNKIYLNATTNDYPTYSDITWSSITHKAQGQPATWFHRSLYQDWPEDLPFTWSIYAPMGTHVQTWLWDQTHSYYH